MKTMFGCILTSGETDFRWKIYPPPPMQLFKKNYLFQLESNYFTILQCILPMQIFESFCFSLDLLRFQNLCELVLLLITLRGTVCEFLTQKLLSFILGNFKLLFFKNSFIPSAFLFSLFEYFVVEPPGLSLPLLEFFLCILVLSVQFSSVAQSCLILCNPMDCSTPGIPVITNFRSLLKLMSIELVMPSNHLILCRPLLLPPSIFPSIRVFSNESVLCIKRPKYWSFSFSIHPSNEYSALISFRMDWLDLPAVQGTLKSLLQHHSLNASFLWHSASIFLDKSSTLSFNLSTDTLLLQLLY